MNTARSLVMQPSAWNCARIPSWLRGIAGGELFFGALSWAAGD